MKLDSVCTNASTWLITEYAIDDCLERLSLQRALLTSISPVLMRSLFNAYESRELAGHFVALLASECDIDKLRLLAATTSEIHELTALRCLIHPVRNDATSTDERLGQPNASSRLPTRWSEADSLQAILDHRDSKRSAIYWLGHPSKTLSELFAEVGGEIPLYIESQPELIGLNSLVRRGRIRVLSSADRTTFISKRSEAGKLAKFKNDCDMALAIRARLRLVEGGSLELSDPSCGAIVVSILPHVAVVAGPKGQDFYVISEYLPFETLEELLQRIEDPESRRKILLQCRLILQKLLRSGVVWVDMAPRNILVRFREERTEYVLLDFEKSYLTDAPATADIIAVHGRGPIFSEEFSAVCTFDEVTEIFSDHYSPKTWTLSDRGPVNLSHPKREIIDLLAGRGITPSMAAYNEVELEVLRARFMYRGRDGAVRRPVYCGFRVDHYLGSEYDRKLTEIFITAGKYALLDETVDAVDFCIRQYEYALLLSDVEKRLVDKNSIGSQQETTLAYLRTVLDTLSDCGSMEPFQKMLDVLARRVAVASLKSAVNWGELTLAGLQERTRSIYLPFLASRAAVTELGAGSISAVVVVTGGFARGDIAPNSDVDFIIVGSSVDVDFESIHHALTHTLEEQSKLILEFCPDQTLGSLAEYLEHDPDALLDSASMFTIAGDAVLADAVMGTLAKVVHGTTPWPALQMTLGLPPTPKTLLRCLNALIRGRYAGSTDVLMAAKDLLYLVKFEEGAIADGLFTIKGLTGPCLDSLVTAVHAALNALCLERPSSADRQESPFRIN